MMKISDYRKLSPEDKDKLVAEMVESWRLDWNKFTRDILGIKLDKQQQEILHAVQHNRRVSVASGTARGKDYVSAVAAFCFLYLTPKFNAQGDLIENTKVALTAPSARQIDVIMMPEIARIYRRAAQKGIIIPGARLNSTEIKTAYEEWFLTGFKADENKSEVWTGFHAVNTMFVVTEATGIPDKVYHDIEGNLQGNSKILIVFNPNILTGYAARSHKDDRWKCFSLSSLDAPNVIKKKEVIKGQVDYEWVKDKVDVWATPIIDKEVLPEMNDFEFEGQWYRPNDLFRKKVLGVFPKIGEDVLIPASWVDAAQARWKENRGIETQNNAHKILGVDVAGMGRDGSAFCFRQGNYVDRIKIHHSGGKADHMAVAGIIGNYMQLHDNLFISIDTIGEGAGVFSRLTELYPDNKKLISCKYNEKARLGSGKELSDITGQYRFYNLRAYLYWCIRDWLNPKFNRKAMLPPNLSLKQELTEPKYSFKSDGKLFIEPKDDIKKRLGRSPDLMDSLANTFYPLTRKIPLNISRLISVAY